MAVTTRNPFKAEAVADLAAEAESLAASIDAISLQASEVARTVMIGMHGRRRAGHGDMFWQFRRFMEGDYAYQIDWRRSARHEHLYVRENELEHAQTVWLWCDLTASMAYRSELADTTKAERALLFTFTLAALLVAHGERVGVPGLAAPTARRRVIPFLADRLAENPETALGHRLPDPGSVSPYSTCVVVSDFLDPVDELEPTLAELADNGVALHFVEILDPSEMDFPFSGRTEFHTMEGGEPFVAGRAETLKEDYSVLIDSHRRDVAEMARQLDATLLHHRTDHNPDLALTALTAQITDRDGELWIDVADEAGAEAA